MKAQRLKPKKDKEQILRRDAYFKLHKLIPKVSLPLDGILCAASGSFHLDVFRLEKQIPNYNGDACTYKGKPKYSMKMAVKEEWGDEVANLINILL